MSQPQTRLEHVLRVGRRTAIAQIPDHIIARILTSNNDAGVCKAVAIYCMTSSRACTDETYDEILIRLNIGDAKEQLGLNEDSREIFKLLCKDKIRCILCTGVNLFYTNFLNSNLNSKKIPKKKY